MYESGPLGIPGLHPRQLAFPKSIMLLYIVHLHCGVPIPIICLGYTFCYVNFRTVILFIF